MIDHQTQLGMSTYNIIASTDESTVVSEYSPQVKRSDAYQSEADLEREFIRMLSEQGYEYLKINDEAGLILNLRHQIEALNGYCFSDSEWKSFFKASIAAEGDGIVEKTRRIQVDNIQVLKCDDGSIRNIKLIDKKNIHSNRLQVINQYEVGTAEGARHDNRYDVTVLVNGLPLVHVELKRRGVAIREAFNQIRRYQRDSFWAGSGLFEYVQIFVISNGTHTKYYSNTTRQGHLKEMRRGQSSNSNRSSKTSNSFEFTSFWADSRNRVIADLVDFTRTFFARHTLLGILTRYCVLTSEDMLLVMRPYQIAATEQILSRIETSSNYRQTGTPAAGGYIWHTTGSGKTLTSFKTAQIASQRSDVDKVLFVVDRKDLDYQTMKEYDRFEKGAANSNTSTAILKKQLENPDTRIIITTIQKLGVFIKSNKRHEVYGKHVVIIFDECHRGHFGELHTAITKAFKKYHIFGFTGTPIFAANAAGGRNPVLKTTQQAFGDKLHTYTIVDAINDGNVLPFRIDYVKTVEKKEGIADSQVQAIDTERVLEAPQRIASVVRYILEHFDQKTKRSEFYSLQGKRVAGFNSILCVSSIPMAMKYYEEFRHQLAARQMTIATIFSYRPNEEENDTLPPDEDFDTSRLDQTSRDFLEDAIKDYNALFGTAYDTSSAKFENYYKDVSQRMKAREIDLLIVVDMFLTGFDATTLNTLWVDKNLKMHGLIQAYSRTNRILNSVKTFGNIVCFRDLQKETDEAIALFGNKDAKGIVVLKPFSDYMNGYDGDRGHEKGYIELADSLKTEFPLGEQIVGEKAKKEFVRLFGAILRLRNILTAFDAFEGDTTLGERELQDYKSMYIDIWNEIKPESPEKEDVNDDVVFEIELIRQVDITIDYILALVEKYRKSGGEDKEIRVSIRRAIDSSLQLRSKKQLIENFIDKVNPRGSVDEDWHAYVNRQKEAELEAIISQEGLRPEPTRRFVDNALRDGELRTTGTDIDGLLPPVSRFSSGGSNRASKKQSVIARLKAFFEKFFGIFVPGKGGGSAAPGEATSKVVILPQYRQDVPQHLAAEDEHSYGE